MDACGHHADRGAGRSEFLLYAGNDIGIPRCDADPAELLRHAKRARELLVGHRPEHPDRRPRCQTPREFGGAENRRCRGIVDEITGCSPGGGRTDATGVKPVVIDAVQEIAPLQEERAPFGEEGLEARQVHLGRIRLDLSEIGIDRRLERQVGAETHLRVQPDTSLEVRAGRERVAWIGVADHLRRARDVRQQLQAATRRDPVDAVQIAETGRPALLRPRHHRPVDFLVP